LLKCFHKDRKRWSWTAYHGQDADYTYTVDETVYVNVLVQLRIAKTLNIGKTSSCPLDLFVSQGSLTLFHSSKGVL
jgi:hypothetical protein